MNGFWWGGGDDGKKIHWVAWNTLRKSKKNGGLGFRNLQTFNDALSGKQCWRLINNEGSLMVKTLKARYYPKSDFLSTKLGFQPSFTWRSIWNSRSIVEEGARWREGSF